VAGWNGAYPVAPTAIRFSASGSTLVDGAIAPVSVQVADALLGSVVRKRKRPVVFL
jgi:hypothetical protein